MAFGNGVENIQAAAYNSARTVHILFFSGCPHHLHDPVDYDCQMVKTLKSWGGVPFCLTNVPQTMFALQCRLEDISTPDLSTTSFNPELSTPDFQP